MVPARQLSFAASVLVVLGLLAVAPARAAAADAQKKGVTLDTVLPSVNFDGVALGDAMAFVHDVTDLTIDWKAMQDAGVKPEAVVKLKVSDKKLRDVILAVFKSAGAEPAPVVTLEKNTVVVKPGKKKAG